MRRHGVRAATEVEVVGKVKGVKLFHRRRNVELINE